MTWTYLAAALLVLSLLALGGALGFVITQAALLAVETADRFVRMCHTYRDARPRPRHNPPLSHVRTRTPLFDQESQ